MAGIRRIAYVLEQESPGVWCASAFVHPGVGLIEDGSTPEAAVEELREALTFVVGDVELTRVATLDEASRFV